MVTMIHMYIIFDDSVMSYNAKKCSQLHICNWQITLITLDSIQATKEKN